MILDDTVQMTWNSNNKKYYIERGYIFTKMYDKFIVKINDLPDGSSMKIKIKCDVCEKIKLLSYCEYVHSVKNGGYYTCSQKCSNGKSKKTCLKNYGVEVPLQSDIGKNKFKQTCLNKYGCEFPSQNIDVKNKVKQTCLNNLGTEYAFQSEIVKEKTKKTCLEKYGVENIFQSEFFRIKQRKTCLERYGVENPFQSEMLKEKSKKTNLKRYGFEYANQNKNIYAKTINTVINKYGEIWKNHVPRFNPNSIIYLDMISEKLNLHIQHALNGGEKKLIKYWIDGFIDKYNICIEWDEESHNLENDARKDEFIKDNFGYKIIRIREKLFLKNPDSEMDNIVNKIKDYILSL